MSLSDNDPEPVGRRGPRIWLVALVTVGVAAVIALHLTGAIGPG
jgi:hypothetical protein